VPGAGQGSGDREPCFPVLVPSGGFLHIPAPASVTIV